ncbi:hypothetical protein F8O07_06460 [Pseudoclavibacter sp. CFCC 13796]|uniref:hypothetical protein n=1 Tax=unclassified Pseudoclavibacter TaxID=2615177 RepID=UPI001301187B|nr:MULTISPECIES: hypothetical protein [unclassified Pseudoclavibacter]KAB1661544.1 hypothetical protein F8O07_06460 [Pseudoclavibacter sp. CFCC 13796]MCD7100576.1 hypothetical protein [Pseudoclavibacter sp. 13-3]
MTEQRISKRIRTALDRTADMPGVAVVVGERAADIDYDSLYLARVIGVVKITDESLTSADEDGVLRIDTSDFDDPYDRIQYFLRAMLQSAGVAFQHNGEHSLLIRGLSPIDVMIIRGFAAQQQAAA